MLLYHNKVEYSRVVEVVTVTEEGMFKKDETPEDYGGAEMDVEVVHMITLTDVTGYIEVLKFDNPEPLDKDRQATKSPVTLDGKDHRSGSGTPRIWVTRPSANLPARVKEKADMVLEIMRTDGAFGSPL